MDDIVWLCLILFFGAVILHKIYGKKIFPTNWGVPPKQTKKDEDDSDGLCDNRPNDRP